MPAPFHGPSVLHWVGCSASSPLLGFAILKKIPAIHSSRLVASHCGFNVHVALTNEVKQCFIWFGPFGEPLPGPCLLMSFAHVCIGLANLF